MQPYALVKIKDGSSLKGVEILYTVLVSSVTSPEDLELGITDDREHKKERGLEKNVSVVLENINKGYIEELEGESENPKGWTNAATKTETPLRQSSTGPTHLLLQNFGIECSKSSSHGNRNWGKCSVSAVPSVLSEAFQESCEPFTSVHLKASLFHLPYGHEDA
ncbi:hypothetical protein STEG23_020149 [Scotinomys teguina]